IAAWVFMPPWMALAFQIHLSKHVSEFSTVEIVPDLGTKQLSVRHPNWTTDPHLFLPLLVKALPDSVDIRADTLAVSLRARDGRTWNSDVAGVRKSSTAPGTMALEAEIVMPRSYFDGEHGQPLSLRASFWGTLLGNSHSQTIPLPYRPANVLDGLRCVMGEFNYLYCRSAFRWPAKLVYAQFHDNDVSSFNMLISYSPFPASLGLNPFESHWISAGARSRDVTILMKEPLAHLRRDFEVAGVRLVEAP